MDNADISIGTQIMQWVWEFLGNMILAALIFLAGWFLAKLAAKVARRAASNSKVDPLVAGFIGSVVKALIIIIATVSAIAQLNINITSLVAALGAAGLTASFALQGSLSNFASGVQIIFTKPFKMGDYLSFGSYEGTVKRIEILYTVLSTFDNKQVIVPNSKITGDVVVNFSSNGTRRLDLAYQISYRADIARAKDILTEVAEKDKRVLKEPRPIIAVGALGDSGVSLVAKLWCRQEEYWNLYYAMQEAVKLAFDREGVEIPFPQMDLHIKENRGETGQNK